MTKPFREESKKSYWCGDNDDATLEQINTGSLQRIADATEKMCLDRERLEREAKDLKWLYRSAADRADRAGRSNAALRGVITRLKRELVAAKEEIRNGP